MTERKAIVRLDGVRVGELSEGADGYCFRYDSTWVDRPSAEPVSRTMPTTEREYRSPSLHPFFENLLPEGWLLELSTAKLKISKDDIFGLLLATCRDCFGSVEIIPVEDE